MTAFWLLLLLVFNAFAKSNGPHIVFIMIDDSGWGNWGYHNNGTNGEIVTPNVDSLARSGLILNRHYVHYICAPTRSSFQSGRLPVHCNTKNGKGADSPHAGVPINYTCIATKMKEANYSTHLVGKWDAGMAVKEQLPHGRGYDTSFGYLQHKNDYWSMIFDACPQNISIVDLWDTDKPAVGYNNTDRYEELIFAEKVVDIINNYKPNEEQKLFLVYTPHIVHEPYEIPKEYYTIYPDDETHCGGSVIYPGFNTSDKNGYQCRSLYQSMVNLMDLIIGNITTALKTKGIWDDTLLIFTGDNGGPESNPSAANNFPLRGGKFVPFEGGIRTASFVNGGYLPDSRRGQIENGMMHIADWYATFLGLNGIDPEDKRAKKAGLPPIDGMNMWDLISGKNLTSPRYELPVDKNTLIQGNYKLITGTAVNYASWGGPMFPNSTTTQGHEVDGTYLNCTDNPCLFDVVNDMTEHKNIAKENGDLVDKMSKRLEELKEGYYSNNETGSATLCPSNITENECGCWMAINYYGGFYGPYETV